MAFKIVRNIGTLDRIVRAGLSFGMIYFGFFSDFLFTDHLARLILGVIGCLNLVVTVVGYCPLYSIIGFSTCTRHTSEPL